MASGVLWRVEEEDEEDLDQNISNKKDPFSQFKKLFPIHVDRRFSVQGFTMPPRCTKPTLVEEGDSEEIQPFESEESSSEVSSDSPIPTSMLNTFEFSPYQPNSNSFLDLLERQLTKLSLASLAENNEKGDRSICSSHSEPLVTNFVPLDLDNPETDVDTISTSSESPVVVDIPEVPFICEHTVSDSTAVITWNRSQGKQRVSFYQVLLQETELKKDKVKNEMPREKYCPWIFNHITGTSVKLMELKPNTEYYIRIRAANLAGPGEWCKPYKFSTLAINVSGFPKENPIQITVLRREPQRKTVHVGVKELRRLEDLEFIFPN
ncbi:fibronectin type III domain-containing protein 8-like [Vombatus ursinus]|uniref:fibronectin type III domain-containing protein 8-like n=1 Tax=Vombatus ursinus TaxID=29139 RepID=UPI000FFD8727|nr:fibronectin type III domain-containing protein 8-like [Vombatus ursinus]XP_027718249.1 fibronectin type III domain-containing protein 8-like [Vombatus ursinus]